MEQVNIKGAIINDDVAEVLAKLQEEGDTIIVTYLRTIEELLDEALEGDRREDWEHAGHLNMLRKDLQMLSMRK